MERMLVSPRQRLVKRKNQSIDELLIAWNKIARKERKTFGNSKVKNREPREKKRLY